MINNPVGIYGFNEQTPVVKKSRFKPFKFLCKLFGHKYIKQEIDLNVWEFVCKRCGKNRDVYHEGESKDSEIRYFTKSDGKKDDK